MDLPDSHALHESSTFVDEVRSLVERNVEPTDYCSFAENKPELFMLIDFESDVVSTLFYEQHLKAFFQLAKDELIRLELSDLQRP